MATNQHKNQSGNGTEEAYQGGVTPSKDEQAKHEKHAAAGKKGGATIKKEQEQAKKK